MILGHGDIATVLQEVDRPDLLFFASGVSNSKEIRESEYEREKQLLMKQTNAFPHLVYFSSLAVFESDTRYIKHKLLMEKLVKTFFPKHTIVRIGNITWGKNPHTLLNFMRNKIVNKEVFEIQDVYRYIVDKDEFLYWVKRIPEWSCELNIPGRRMKVVDIIYEYCRG